MKEEGKMTDELDGLLEFGVQCPDGAISPTRDRSEAHDFARLFDETHDGAVCPVPHRVVCRLAVEWTAEVPEACDHSAGLRFAVEADAERHDYGDVICVACDALVEPTVAALDDLRLARLLEEPVLPHDEDAHRFRVLVAHEASRRLRERYEERRAVR
jgi:hypothetical protein